MSFTTKITHVRHYDNINGHESPVSFSWSMQEIGSGENAGRNGSLVTVSAVPGSIVDEVYVRTDTTSFPKTIADLIGTAWTEDVHTAYEAHLRA